MLSQSSDYFQQHFSKITFSSNSWTVLSNISQLIKTKVEKFGVPLKNWDVKINYGIKTGFNEAFIITNEKRKEILEKCPEADSIIRPILRGRDIQKYYANWAGLYLINTHTGFQNQKGEIIPPIKIEDYPAVKNHLDEYYSQLSERQDKGITPYHLRSCIYTEDFFKPKIIYPEITKFINFYLDTDKNYYINNKCFILTGENIEYLTAFFNSKLFRFCFTENFPELMGGTRELRKVFFEKIPVLKVSSDVNKKFKVKIVELDKLEKNRKEIELELNQMINQLYSLTDEEVNYIQSSVLD